MLFKTLQSTLFILCLTSCAALGTDRVSVDLGRWNKTELAQIMTAAHNIDASGERIVALSGHFLATPYVAGTLIGNPQIEEQLVINLAGFDCFTFLDVVEALRRASDVDDFPERLKQVRYRDGKVAYLNRRHFFSDWVAGADALVGDVTTEVGQGGAFVVDKQLNLKSDGTHWLPQIPVFRRGVSYIPTSKIDKKVLSALQSGDYVGVFSALDGLDVSHTGLIVRQNESVMLRHASSRNSVRQVVDVELLTYLQGQPGLVVYRLK